MSKTEKASQHVEYEGTLDFATAKQTLKDLLSSFRQGRVVIEHGEEHVTLEPGQVVKVKLSGSEKGEKQSLELKLSWTRTDESEEGDSELRISSEEQNGEETEYYSA